MNEEFVTQFYSSACNVLRVVDENGKYRNNVCFSMVDDQGHYMICLKKLITMERYSTSASIAF